MIGDFVAAESCAIPLFSKPKPSRAVKIHAAEAIVADHFDRCERWENRAKNQFDLNIVVPIEDQGG